MSKSPASVRVRLAHNQDINGKPHQAGDEVEVPAAYARVLAARGGGQAISEAQAEAAANDPDSATVADLRALAEKRGVDLSGVSRKADIQAAIDAAPKTAAPAEKGGK